MTLGLAGAINRKMVLINFVQDQIMNTFRYGKMETKKIVSPYSTKYSRDDSDFSSAKNTEEAQSWVENPAYISAPKHSGRLKPNI